MSLTQARLKEVLDYDHETGVFTYATAIGGHEAGDIAGTKCSKLGYVRIYIDRWSYFGHRLAYLWVNGEWPPHQIDHINFDRADNRWSNLREATNAQNCWHQGLRSNNTSGVRGVKWNVNAQKWCVEITANGQYHYLGIYGDLEEARAARIAAEHRLHGEFVGIQ